MNVIISLHLLLFDTLNDVTFQEAHCLIISLALRHVFHMI